MTASCGNFLANMSLESPSSPATLQEPLEIDWEAALSEHDRWLRTIVRSRVGEAAAVDEVMQEVALAAVRQAAPLSDATKVGPWLYRLAVRQSLLYRRKIGRQKKLTQRYTDKFRPTETDHRRPDPLSWILASERQKMIRIALDRLLPNDREILLLKYTESWSYHEIADHLGVSHSAVEARLHRARQRMKSELTALNVIDSSRSRGD